MSLTASAMNVAKGGTADVTNVSDVPAFLVYFHSCSICVLYADAESTEAETFDTDPALHVPFHTHAGLNLLP